MMPPAQPQPGMAPGAPPPQPPAPPPPLPYQNTAPALTDDDVSDWRMRLEAARDPIAAIITEGKTNTARYRVKHLLKAPLEAEVVVPLDFSYTEQKKAQLISQMPEINLEATRPELENTVPIAKSIINAKLGPKPVGVDAITAIFEGMTDVVCGVGFMVCKIGIEVYVDGTKPVNVGEEPVPGGQPGSILGLGPTPMRPIMQDAPNVVSEQYYWKRVPPGYFRAPADFTGSDFDDADWVAHRFKEDVPADDPKGGRRSRRGGGQNDDDLLLIDPVQTSRTKPPVRWGTEAFYRACRFDPTCKNPELVRTFKLYDDDDAPSVHEDSRDQRWAADGSLIGMAGYPLHVLTLRYTSDTCFPASDIQNIRQTIDEVSKGRTQLLRRRDRSLPQVGYDATAVTPDSLAAIQKNENTGFIGFNRPVDDSTFREIPKGTFGRENFAFNDQGMQDIDRAMALGANAGVLRSDSPETATKSNQVQSAVDTRLEAERFRVATYCVKGAMKLFGLLQVYADKPDWVRLEGESGAARMEQWTKLQIPGPYAFKARPDSHIRLDATQLLDRALKAYNLLANDPYVRREEMVKPVALQLGVDPARIMKQPDKQGPPPAKGSVTISPADFVGPQAPAAQAIAAAIGITIPDEMMQAMSVFGQLWSQIQAEQKQAAEAAKAASNGLTAGDTAHGGAADRVAPIDKHQADLTGGTPGIGRV